MREIGIFLLWIVAWALCGFFVTTVAHWAFQWWKLYDERERP